MVLDTQNSSEDELYALLGRPESNEPTSITHPDWVTRSAVSLSSNKRLATEPLVKTDRVDPIPYSNNKHRETVRRSPNPQVKPPKSSRSGDDSDDPVKETVHVTPTMRSTATPKLDVSSFAPRSDAYWMYGQEISAEEYKSNVRKREPEVKKEMEEVKEKDFADAPVVKGAQDVKETQKDESTSQIKSEDPVISKQGGMLGLLEQLMRSIDDSKVTEAARTDQGPEIKQEEMSIEMYKVPTSSTADEGLTTADESFYTDTDIKPPRQFHVVQHQTRVKGSNKRRQRYQIVRHIRASSRAAKPVPEEVEVKVEPEPLPETAFQRDLQTTFSRSALLQVNELAKVDNTSGNYLPSHLRDLFPALADPASAVTVANHLRRQFDLPLLSNKTDRVALRRSVAQMRLGIYTEIVSALLLPSAPDPSPDTDDEEGKVKTKKISLVPSALQHMQKALPAAFPNEKYTIKLFLANHDVLGEIKGKVVWQDGIGKIVGGDPNGPAFRGKISADGLVHVFVDHSNVLHGLSSRLQKFQSSALPPKHLRTLSLPIVSLLLRRGRPTPHGSLHLVASSPIQQNLDPLVRLGWEVSVLKRVEIYDDEVYDSQSAKLVPKPKNTLAKINGFQEGGSRRYKEQGVDEILHLKILQALNTKPIPAPKGSTIVLATGDAKGGQFNQDGFLGAVREAIKRGWMVELWSFSEGLSRAWKDVKKKENWDGHFTIKLLDEWAEQLVEVGDGD